jgi:hypothetical protein
LYREAYVPLLWHPNVNIIHNCRAILKTRIWDPWGSVVLPLIGWIWVIGAEKDEGTIELCSIATLLKITTTFYKLLFSQRAFGLKNHAKYYMSRLH